MHKPSKEPELPQLKSTGGRLHGIGTVGASGTHKRDSRNTFLNGRFFEGMGKTQRASIALGIACGLRQEITKEDQDVKSLTAADFEWMHKF